MARLARFVLTGNPHHVTQRGKGRQQTYFSDADYAAVLKRSADRLATAHPIEGA